MPRIGQGYYLNSLNIRGKDNDFFIIIYISRYGLLFFIPPRYDFYTKLSKNSLIYKKNI